MKNSKKNNTIQLSVEKKLVKQKNIKNKNKNSIK